MTLAATSPDRRIARTNKQTRCPDGVALSSFRRQFVQSTIEATSRFALDRELIPTHDAHRAAQTPEAIQYPQTLEPCT